MRVGIGNGRSRYMDKHDIQEIKNLIRFKERLLRQLEEEKNLTYEERIIRYIKRWRGEQ